MLIISILNYEFYLDFHIFFLLTTYFNFKMVVFYPRVTTFAND